MSEERDPIQALDELCKAAGETMNQHTRDVLKYGTGIGQAKFGDAAWIETSNKPFPKPSIKERLYQWLRTKLCDWFDLIKSEEEDW